MRYSLACQGCGEVYDSDYASQVCGKCGGLLEVVCKGRLPKIKLGKYGYWHYKALLPEGKYRRYAVGGTELAKCSYIDGLYLKLENENTTGSFKDRGSVIEIGKAVEYGFSEIVCASTGNMAYSLAHYAMLSGLRAKVFVTEDAYMSKIRKIKASGASVVRVNGYLNKAIAIAEAYAKKRGAFLTGDYCYRKEGQKTMAYEIMGQLRGAKAIVVPVGNATLIAGMLKAIEELKELRAIPQAPRIVAVQAAGCAPLIKAFESGRALKYERPNTAADGIAVGLPKYGEQALEAISKTHGDAIAVSDASMESARKELLARQGIMAELAGVASIAAASTMRNDKTVAIISGGNVKG